MIGKILRRSGPVRKILFLKSPGSRPPTEPKNRDIKPFHKRDDSEDENQRQKTFDRNHIENFHRRKRSGPAPSTQGEGTGPVKTFHRQAG